MVRPYYNRDLGRYWLPEASVTPTAAVPQALKGARDPAGKDRLRKIADSYLGVPYDFGGQSRSGMDCSGFIRQVYQEVYGLRLPHSSGGMYGLGKAIPKASLKAGDVVFFRRFGFIDHAGIYMGGDYFIHASTSAGVAYSALNAPYFGDHYAGARRIAPEL